MGALILFEREGCNTLKCIFVTSPVLNGICLVYALRLSHTKKVCIAVRVHLGECYTWFHADELMFLKVVKTSDEFLV